MAFKTDSIKLENYTGNAARDAAIPTPSDGQMVINGGVLQVYDTSWANVSSGGGGGGGGASELSDLSDVPSAPSTQYDVPVVDSASQLVFQPLLTTLTDSSSLYTGTQFGDDNTHLMTAQAIKNKIEDYGYASGNSSNWDDAFSWGDHGVQGYVSNTTSVTVSPLAADVTLSTGLNQKYVIMSDPSTYKFRLNNPAGGYALNTIIEIINMSNYDQIISTGGSFLMFNTNTGLDTTNDITIQIGQRGLIMVSENPLNGQNNFYVTTLSV